MNKLMYESLELNHTSIDINDSEAKANAAYSGTKVESLVSTTKSTLETEITTAETNAKNLSNATGTLAVANGGTGATSLDSVTVGKATNLASGAAGSIPYQSEAGKTAFLSAGTEGQLLKSSGASGIEWLDRLDLFAGFSGGLSYPPSLGSISNLNKFYEPQNKIFGALINRYMYDNFPPVGGESTVYFVTADAMEIWVTQTCSCFDPNGTYYGTFIRNYNGSTWTSWVEIATVDSTVAKAKKLDVNTIEDAVARSAERTVAISLSDISDCQAFSVTVQFDDGSGDGMYFNTGLIFKSVLDIYDTEAESNYIYLPTPNSDYVHQIYYKHEDSKLYFVLKTTEDLVFSPTVNYTIHYW